MATNVRILLHRIPMLVANAVLVVGLGACGTAGTGRGADDARDLEVSDDPGVELVGDAVEVEPPEADEPGDAETVDTPVAGLALTFVDEWGDDGLTCEHSDTCAITVTPYGSRDLSVRVTEDGLPRRGVAVLFEVVDDPYGAGFLDLGGAATTDASGQAITEVIGRLLWPEPVTFGVRVSLPDAPEVPPIRFVLRVNCKCLPPLSVTFVYEGSQPFDGIVVYLFVSEHPTQATLPCTAVDPQSLPSADLQIGPLDVTQAAVLGYFPGLQEQPERFVTILANAQRQDGTVVASGCDDTHGYVWLAHATRVVVTLTDVGTGR